MHSEEPAETEEKSKLELLSKEELVQKCTTLINISPHAQLVEQESTLLVKQLQEKFFTLEKENEKLKTNVETLQEELKESSKVKENLVDKLGQVAVETKELIEQGDKLTTDIELLKHEKLKIFEDLTNTLKQNEILDQNIGDLEVKLNQMNEVKGEMEYKINELNKKNRSEAEVRETICKLNNENLVLKERVDQLTNENVALAKNVELGESENGLIQSTLNTLEKTLDRKETEIRNLEETVEKLKVDRKEAEERRREVETKLTQLIRKVEELETLLAQKVQIIEKHVLEIQQLKQTSSAAKNLVMKKEEMEKLKACVQERDEAIEKLENDLIEKDRWFKIALQNKERQHHEYSSSGSEAILKSVKIDLDQAKNRIELLEFELDEKSILLKQLEADSSHEKLEVLEKENKEIKENIETLEIQLRKESSSHEKLEVFEKENKEMKENIETLKIQLREKESSSHEKIEVLEKEKKELEGTIVKLEEAAKRKEKEAELDEMRSPVFELESTLRDKEQRVLMLEEHKTKLSAELADREAQVSAIQNELDAKCDRISAMQEEINSKVTRLASMEEQMEMESGKVEEQRAENVEQIQSLREELRDKNARIYQLELTIANYEDTQREKSTFELEKSENFKLSLENLENDIIRCRLELETVERERNKWKMQCETYETESAVQIRALEATQNLAAQLKEKELSLRSLVNQYHVDMQDDLNRALGTVGHLLTRGKNDQDDLVQEISQTNEVLKDPGEKISLAQENTELKESGATLETERYNKLKILTVKYKKSFAESSQKLEIVSKENAGLVNKLQSLTNQIKTASIVQSEYDSICEKYEAACKLASQREKSLVQLEQKLAKLEQTVGELREVQAKYKLKEKFDEKQASEIILKDKDREIAQLTDTNAHLSEQIVVLRAGIAQYSDAKVEVSRYEKRIAELEELREEMQAKLNSLEHLNEECSSLSTTLSALQSTHTQLNKEHRITLDTLTTLNDSYKTAQWRIEELLVENTVLCGERERLSSVSNEMETLDLKLKEVESQLCTVQLEKATLSKEFEVYKKKAQCVLEKTKKEQLDASASSEETNGKLSHLESQVDTLSSQLTECKKDLLNLKHSHSLSFSEKETLATRLEVATSELSVQEQTIAQLKEEKINADMMIIMYKQQVEESAAQIKSLKELVSNAQPFFKADNTESSLTHTEKHLETEKSTRERCLDGSELERRRIEDVLNSDAFVENISNMASLYREEGEGSEYTDTPFITSHVPIPLEELLSSNEDQYQHEEDILARLASCQSQVVHLTSLLNESENNAARHEQQTNFLKQEIRRLERAVERQPHVKNSEYLKNVMLKFLTLQGGDEKKRLIPVLNTMLKLSPEEVKLLTGVAKGQAGDASSSWSSLLGDWTARAS